MRDNTALPTIADLVERTVAASPTAPAVVAGGRTLSYAELDAAANQLAHTLIDVGAGPDQVVGLCLPRSCVLPVAVLGVWRAGAAYTVADAANPPARNAFVLEDAGTPVAVTEPGWGKLLGTYAGRVLEVDDDLHALSGASPDRPEMELLADGLAYVLYTSGSTGTPKGVAMSRRCLDNLMRWQLTEARPGARWLAFAPLGFDVCFQELFGAWVSGGTAVVASDAERADVGLLADLLERAEVERATLPVGVLKLLSAECRARGLRLSSLREVGTTGEQAQLTDAARELLASLPGRRFHNHYGPSETHVVSAEALNGNPRDWPSRPSIGRPLPGVELELLDEQLQPLPVGAVGELFVGGPNALARGYLGRPALTAERFLPDEGGRRRYRTGDLARLRADGTFDYIGRRDAQVKLHGVRIEPAEVEATLGGHPDVHDCGVAVVGAERGSPRLVAFVRFHRGRQLDERALREWLADRLPPAFVPASLVPVQALPLTPSGKLDRRALPGLWERPAARAGDEGSSDADLTAAVMAAVAAAVGVEQVRADDDFLALGGDSLAAMALAADLRAVTGREVRAGDVLERHGVGELVALLARRPPAASLASPDPEAVGTSSMRAPASPEQQRLWFLDRLIPNRAAYNVPLVMRLRGALDPAALAAALDEVAMRHQALRTTLPARNGVPEQRIADKPLHSLRIAEIAPQRLDAELDRELHEPFELEPGPLMRARLMSVGEREHVLALTFHHTIVDARSLRTITEELSAAYTARVRDAAPNLPPPGRQFRAVVARQRAELAPTLEQQLEFWRGELEGVPALLELPPDRQAPPVPSGAGGVAAFRLSDNAASLAAVARDLDATVFMVVLAAYATLLARHAGHDDVVIGTFVSTRDEPADDSVVGMLVATVPIRVRVGGDPTFAHLVERVRSAVVRALTHRTTPFDRIVQAVGPARTLGTAPLVQAALAFDPRPPAPAFADVQATLLPRAPRASQFEVTLNVDVASDPLEARWDYDADRFVEMTAQRWSEQLRALIAGATANPQRRLSDLTGAIGRRPAPPQVASARRDDLLLHELVERQAEHSPDRPAVVAGPATLTYAQLDRASNRLAHCLRTMGIGPETPVGLCLPRSLLMPIAVLATLKAGGAYVPLDPNHPPARTAFVLGDTGAQIVIATGSTVSTVPAGDHALLELDDELSRLEGAPSTPLARRGSSRMLAYILHTSGSTGTPKGVAVAHAQATWFVESAVATVGAHRLARTAFTTSLGFDVSLFELFAPLACGGALVMFENALLLAENDSQRLTLLSMVPSVGSEIASGGVLPGNAGTVVFAGETLTSAVVESVVAAGATEVWNCYGPTETTVFNTAAVVDPNEAQPPLGQPLAGAGVYVLDECLEPVPDGVTGQVHVGGPFVARGYLARPALTAERFVPDPFAGTPGARMYRTGDLARRRPDGELAFRGRVDAQLKVRGFRVEPGEIEAALMDRPGILDAVVSASAEQEGRTLVAYVRRHPGKELGDLRAALADQLPPHMVPGEIVEVADLPRTPSGKIDRARIGEAPRVHPEHPESLRATLQEGKQVERTVAHCWERVLGHDRFGADDAFFDVGGHSLLLLQLRAELMGELGIEPQLMDLLRYPTVRSLGAHLDPHDSTPRRPRRRTASVADARAARLGRRKARRT